MSKIVNNHSTYGIYVTIKIAFFPLLQIANYIFELHNLKVREGKSIFPGSSFLSKPAAVCKWCLSLSVRTSLQACEDVLRRGSLQEKFAESYCLVSAELILGIEIYITLIILKRKPVNKFLLIKFKKILMPH